MSEDPFAPITKEINGFKAREDALLASVLSSYRQSASTLREFNQSRYRTGQFVRVDDPRFKGVGMVAPRSSEIPPDLVPVRLENDNVWWYRIESIRETVPAKDAPRQLRRMKLRLNGYRIPWTA